MSLKIDNYETVLTTLFDCGYADLEVIADVRNDILADCITEILGEFGAQYIDINSLMCEVFRYKMAELQQVIDERIEELKDCVELTEEELFELETISSLNPFEDIDSCCNFLDTSVFFVDNEDIYRKYFSKAVESFEKDTGFSLN